MSINSRQKGARAERLLASKLREYGYEARRGCQYAGKNGDADVEGLPGVHIECKAVQRLNVLDAYDQSRRDARPGEIPVVMHKKDYTPWYVTLSLEDFLRLYRDWEGYDE